MKRLLLMSGIHHPEGWVTLDANPANKPDIVATIPPIGLATPAYWDHIEWIHGITSLYPWAAVSVLGEIRQLLTDQGLLVLEQPNLEEISFSGKPEWIYGDPSAHDPLHMNRWAYTPQNLAEAVRAAGFTRINVTVAQHHNPARDFRLEARP